MSQTITFQGKPFTAKVPKALKTVVGTDVDNLFAHSTQELNHSVDLKSRLWVLPSSENYLFLADQVLGLLPAELNLEKEFTVTLISGKDTSTLQFMQEDANVGEALVCESELKLVELEEEKGGKEKTVIGYSYTQILGAICLLAALALGATYATSTFPFNAAQKA